MTETKASPSKYSIEIISWFFLSVIVLSLFGIVLMVSGFPETYLFVNLSTMFLASGIISCFFTFYFTRKELEKEWNRQQGVV